MYLIQATLVFASGSLLHFLIGLCSSRVSYGRRERPSRIRETVFLLNNNVHVRVWPASHGHVVCLMNGTRYPPVATAEVSLTIHYNSRGMLQPKNCD